MKIEDIQSLNAIDFKGLEKLLKIFRKQGVTDISFDGVSIKLGDLPVKNNADDSDEIQTEELTPEQMMFYAVGGGQQ